MCYPFDCPFQRLSNEASRLHQAHWRRGGCCPVVGRARARDRDAGDRVHEYWLARDVREPVDRVSARFERNRLRRGPERQGRGPEHDCGHGAFFPHRVANDWLGRVIGVLTLTPYDFWRRTHAIHHATSGNLERRGIGDVDTLTVNEYLARSKWGRLRYRLYRHPIIMFGVGPAYLFILQYRLPLGLVRAGWQPWLSTMGTNLAIAILMATVIRFMGCVRFCWSNCRSRCWGHRSASGFSMSSISSKTRSGPMSKPGISTK